MMVEDLGVEAKEAAVREVAKLLPLPELLQSISAIKADYIARQQVSLLDFNCYRNWIAFRNIGIDSRFESNDLTGDYFAVFPQANDAQLSTMVAEQVEQAEAGLESLSSSEKTIYELRDNFISIDKYVFSLARYWKVEFWILVSFSSNFTAYCAIGFVRNAKLWLTIMTR